MILAATKFDYSDIYFVYNVQKVTFEAALFLMVFVTVEQTFAVINLCNLMVASCNIHSLFDHVSVSSSF